MTDTPIDRESVERLAQHTEDACKCEYDDFDVSDTLRALLAAKEAAGAERDEAINQLDSARHSVGVLERRCGEFRDRAEAAEAERDEAIAETIRARTNEDAEKAQADLLKAEREKALREAAHHVSMNLWKHGGADSYSAGMDAGARDQSRRDIEAILALIEKKPGHE